jgi:hypothetical protein
MLADMSDVAHLDEGRLQRLVEQEALALNKLLLDNRCEAHDACHYVDGCWSGWHGWLALLFAGCSNCLGNVALTPLHNSMLQQHPQASSASCSRHLEHACYVSTCACRQVAADALQRLHEQQVLLEQSRRQRWEAALASCRTLRSKHAIACFCEHVTVDLSEPPARLHAFAQLRAAQEDAHVQLQQLCKRVGQLLPPHLSSEAVQAWAAAAQQWNEGWQRQLDGHMQQLQEQEDEVEQQVRLQLADVPAMLLLCVA